MAVRRVGSVRLPDDQNNAWAAPNHILPGDVLSGAPAFGGQSMREAPGPIVTEEHMAAVEPQEAPTQAKAPRQARKPRVKAFLPPEASRVAVVPSTEPANRIAINLRLPAKLIEHYKLGGKGYQTRMIAVLELFIEEGGEFIEV